MPCCSLVRPCWIGQHDPVATNREDVLRSCLYVVSGRCGLPSWWRVWDDDAMVGAKALEYCIDMGWLRVSARWAGWLRLMGAQVCCAAQVGDVPACWPMKWRVIRGKVLDGAQANCASCCCCVCCRCALLSARALRCAGLAGQIDGVARESLHVGTDEWKPQMADNGTDWNGSRKTGNEVQCPDETGEVQRRSNDGLV